MTATRESPPRVALGGRLRPRRRPPMVDAPARRRARIRGAISVVVVLVAWELLVRLTDVSSFVLVGPIAILKAFWVDIQNGSLLHHFVVSMHQFAVGYLIAVVLAIPLGLWVGISLRARDYIEPWLIALYATPSVGLAPILIVTLGFDVAGHAAVIALTAFFPIVINTVDGVRAVDRNIREVGVAFRANSLETFRAIALPGASPYLFTGLRLGLARGLVGIVVADLFGASAGLGYMIFTAARTFRTDQLFVAVTVLALLGLIFTVVLRQVQGYLMPWWRPYNASVAG